MGAATTVAATMEVATAAAVMVVSMTKAITVVGTGVIDERDSAVKQTPLQTIQANAAGAKARVREGAQAMVDTTMRLMQQGDHQVS